MSQKVRTLRSKQEYLDQALEDPLSQALVEIDYYENVVAITNEKIEKLIKSLKKEGKIEKDELVGSIKYIKETLNW